MKLIKYTKSGIENLKREIEHLENSRTPAVKELSRARELGDLSENGLYTAAKARLRSIDSQLRRLTNNLKLAEIVDSKRIIVEEMGEQKEYELVGDFEADPANNKISTNSPIGHSLNSAEKGNTVTIQTPKGERKLKVVDVLQ